MWWPAAVCGRLSPTAPHWDFPGGGETQHKTYDLTSACQAPAHTGSGGTLVRGTPRDATTHWGQGQMADMVPSALGKGGPGQGESGMNLAGQGAQL